MVTADEIARIPLFETLSGPDRERLSKAAADIQLAAGEYAAHEGEERALFAVLEGRIEVVKDVDGIERTLGVRTALSVFGEVPIVMGTTFPAGFRAAEPSRVMRIEARDYYAAAAASPEVAEKLGALAQERIGGLQGVAAERPTPRAIVVGHSWDSRCGELRRFLDRNRISFELLTPDGESDGLVLRVADGPTLVEPSQREVAEALGLQTRPASADYDVVVVGGGPAGLAAAVYGASEGLRTVVVEREAPGGQAGTSSRIENYLGFPGGVSGYELGQRALEQAQRLGAEILVTRSIAGIDPTTRSVTLDGDDVLVGRSIIVATGVAWRRLPIDGFDRLLGKGVYVGASRSDAPSTHGHDVHVVGAGNSAGQAAMYFSSHARRVTIVYRGGALENKMSRYLVDQVHRKSNIDVLLRAEVVGVHGDASLAAIDVVDNDTGAVTRHDSGGVFVFIGADTDTAWLPPEIAVDPAGYVLTGPDVKASGRWDLGRDPYLLETSVPGIFACGDVRFGPVKRVAAAVGEGSMAIAFVHQYLRGESS